MLDCLCEEKRHERRYGQISTQFFCSIGPVYYNVLDNYIYAPAASITTSKCCRRDFDREPKNQARSSVTQLSLTNQKLVLR